ncbi:RidA family protein [Erwinia sp. AnSW2-5]|uniref:RidA family protein n=1 Tax=Erwinia sp. AnSW2-5 TaxID=3367692 RepID=UPI00385B38C2
MRTIIDTGLPDIGQPFSWATQGGGMLFTAHGPVNPDGSVEIGSSEKQITLTFDNLAMTLKAAKINSDNVLQVIVYLTDERDILLLDVIYKRYFNAPYPNRSTVIIEKLVVPGMKIEITVSAIASSRNEIHKI